MKSAIVLISLITLFSHSSTIAYEQSEDPAPTLKMGADVYAKRCILCHGTQGMGEGAIPFRIKNYPDTNLVTPHKATSFEQIYNVIVYGGMDSKISEYMPPYGRELSWTELESVAKFINHLRKDTKQALALLSTSNKNQAISQHQGEQIFSTRCVLCHGKYGEGDGRMTKVLKNPSPSDLTASVVPEIYLKKIIELGGERMGRSKHMPPWGEQLSESEINSVVLFLMSIRDKK